MIMVSIDLLIEQLDSARSTGQGRWIARCPAHADGRPSLSVRETGDGVILLHCFAGCETEDVLGAIGWTFSELYPEKAISHRVPRKRRPFSSDDALRCCSHEALIVEITVNKILRGAEITAGDRDRLELAVNRLMEARDATS